MVQGVERGQVLEPELGQLPAFEQQGLAMLPLQRELERAQGRQQAREMVPVPLQELA